MSLNVPTYTGNTWVDNSEPDLSAENLNKIETGVTNAVEGVNKIAGAVTNQFENEPEKIASAALAYQLNSNLITQKLAKDTDIDTIETDGYYAIEYSSGQFIGFNLIRVRHFDDNSDFAEQILTRLTMDDAKIYKRHQENGVWKAWESTASNSDLNSNAISTSGLTCSWGTIEDGGYAKVGKIVIVNVRVRITSELNTGTDYYISGLPQIKSDLNSNIGSFSSNWQNKMQNMYAGFDSIHFTPSENISTNAVMLFSTTYVTS